MRLSAAVFAVSLLVLATAATNIPPTAAQVKVGGIVLDPTHAAPGTLVSFKGIGWDYLGERDFCVIISSPVEIDEDGICNCELRNGTLEPVGTFVVKDVSPGNYSIIVTISHFVFSGSNVESSVLTAGAPFTVDPVATVTSVSTTTLGTPEVAQNSILAIFIVAVLAVVVLRRRKKPSS